MSKNHSQLFINLKKLLQSNDDTNISMPNKKSRNITDKVINTTICLSAF